MQSPETARRAKRKILRDFITNFGGLGSAMFLAGAMAGTASAQGLVNGDFSAAQPLQGWRTATSAAIAQQGGAAVFQTGSGEVLATLEQTFTSPAPFILRFDFGFSTTEMVLPGVLLDSFTVSVRDESSGQSAILITADPTGFQKTPSSPGQVPINVDTISLRPITYPAGVPSVGQAQAFTFEATLPPVFGGSGTTLIFDLFDNQNSLGSVAFVDNVMVVPEPSSMALGALGIVVLCYRRRVR
jgi:hypothetical protein